jgi:hypothetical protein
MQVERLVLGGGTAGATGGDRKRLIDLGRNLWHYLTDRLDDVEPLRPALAPPNFRLAHHPTAV